LGVFTPSTVLVLAFGGALKAKPVIPIWQVVELNQTMLA